ncbi:MAG: hypothetical protein AAF662_16820 [Pseudomonadota bacterium]
MSRRIELLQRTTTRLLFLVSFLLLPGCLYIELHGPVTDAVVTIEPLRGGQPLLENGRSYSLDRTRALFTEDKWPGLEESVRLGFMGAVDIPKDQFDNDTFYLVTVRGGNDWDVDLDGVLDESGEPVAGTWHGLFTGAQLKGISRVSALSEAVYQYLLPDLDRLDDQQLADAIDEAAMRVTRDVNSDGVVDHEDLVAWSAIAYADDFRGEAFLIERMRRDVMFDWGADASALDGEQLVDRAPWSPARPDGLYAPDLLSCMSPVYVAELCPMEFMPVLGQTTSQATVNDVMERVVVSHEWMADRFEQVLSEMPPILLTMMQSITAIAIGDTIRPSYFTRVTNAIYLDPDFLWLTAEEFETISLEEDFRGEFRSRVNFSDLWRFVKDGVSVGRTAYDVDAQGSRNLEQILPWVASLLFHELAHANAAIPSSRIPELSPFAAPFQQNFADVSDEFVVDAPLLATELKGVAGVLFLGAEPSAREASYSASEIGLLFGGDRANDLYSYSTNYEDLAMLVEEFMMAVHFDTYRDVAFTPLPPGDAFCDDYRVSWGERNRIAIPAVRQRLESVLAALFPDIDFTSELNQLAPPRSLPVGLGWCEYLEQLSGVVSPLRAQSGDGGLPPPQPRRLRRTRVVDTLPGQAREP